MLNNDVHIVYTTGDLDVTKPPRVVGYDIASLALSRPVFKCETLDKAYRGELRGEDNVGGITYDLDGIYTLMGYFGTYSKLIGILLKRP